MSRLTKFCGHYTKSNYVSIKLWRFGQFATKILYVNYAINLLPRLNGTISIGTVRQMNCVIQKNAI